MENTTVVIWLIWTAVLWMFYHKIFEVHYFNLGGGLFKEFLISFILGAMMTGLTLHFWVLAVIVLAFLGFWTYKKTSNILILSGCIILAIIIAVTGPRFRKEMKGGEDAESQKIGELLDTYLDGIKPEDTGYQNKNEKEDTENYDSLNDIVDQMFENDEMPEYSLSETYMNEEEGICFKYSSEWKLADLDEIGDYYIDSDLENIVAFLVDSTKDISEAESFILVLKVSAGQADIEQLFISNEDFKAKFAEKSSNVETSVIELNGTPARVVSFITPEEMAWRNYYYSAGSDLYQISFVRKKNAENLESYFDAVIDTYTIIPVEHESAAVSSDYILENSDSQYLTRLDLEGLSANDCRLARNELYARHGRRFNSEDIQNYFDSCSWYQGVIEPDDFQESILNDIEIANRDLIIEYEKEMGYR